MSEKRIRRVIVAREVTASFPYLKEPRAPLEEGGQPKFSMSLVFLPDVEAAQESLRAMKNMAMEVLKEVYGAKTAQLLKEGKVKWPFRDGELDIEEKGYPTGSTFLNVNNKRQPGVVSIVPGPDGRPMTIDPASIYPGAVCHVSLDCYAYNVGASKGVTFGLRNVQFVKDGPRLDGIKRAQDEFEADPGAAASLAELTQDEGELSEIL